MCDSGETINCPDGHNNKGKRSLCARCRTRLFRVRHPSASRIRYLKARAKKKKVPFDLTVEWLDSFLIRTGYDPTKHHIDRKVTSEGYAKHNLQILTIHDNCSKAYEDRTGMMSFSNRYQPIEPLPEDLCPF